MHQAGTIQAWVLQEEEAEEALAEVVLLQRHQLRLERKEEQSRLKE
jgi:hypothetical protein